MYSVNTILRLHINKGITGTHAQFGPARHIRSDTESVKQLDYRLLANSQKPSLLFFS